MTRRKDLQLRQAIDEVTSCPAGKRSLKDIYGKLLAQSIAVTRSRIGLLFSYYGQSDGEKFVLIAAYQNDSTKNEKQASYCTDILIQPREINLRFLTALEQRLSRGEHLILGQPFGTEIRESLPEAATSCQKLVLVPIMNKATCYAIMLLGSDYCMEDEHIVRLMPLLAAGNSVRNTFLYKNNSPLLKISEYSEPPQPEDSYKYIYKQLLDFSFNSIIITNQFGVVHSVNRTAKLLLGIIDDKEIIGHRISQYLLETYPNELQVRTSAYNSLEMIKNRYFPSKMRCRTVKGRILQVEMTFFQHVIRGENSNIFIIDDKTSLIKEQQIREEEERRFLAVADLVPIGILQTNERWECEYVNSAWCDMAGLGRDEVQGLGWVNAIHESDSSRVINEMSDEIKKGRRYEVTCRFQNPLGETLWVDFNASPLISEDGFVEGFIATANDVTLHHTTEEKLRKVAQYDPLTKLANRSLLHERLTHILPKLERRNGKLAILYIDLDGFKNINDSLGHDSGDLILQEVAERLLKCVRTSDTVSRLGGDEFTIILEDITEAYAASEVAEKIIEAISKPFQLTDQEIFLTTSIGITLSSRKNIEATQLLKQADIALYQAKAEGRNNYQFYTSELASDSQQRMQMGNMLHRALEKNEFKIHYQPQAEIDSGKIIGFEALLRWIPENSQEVPVDQFMPLLEETGLIQSIGRWLVEQSFQQFKQWTDLGLVDDNYHLCINLSPRQFRDKQLIDTIQLALQRTAVNASCIVFEVTETLLLDNTDRCCHLMQSIKKLGAKIALDDFGTGFSSLSHLKNFPIDIIKIDQSFVADLLDDQGDKAIVRAVIAMGESLNKRVIAEGVDSDAKLIVLAELGCHWYQGFSLSTPLEASDMSMFLEQQQEFRFTPHANPLSLRSL